MKILLHLENRKEKFVKVYKTIRRIARNQKISRNSVKFKTILPKVLKIERMRTRTVRIYKILRKTIDFQKLLEKIIAIKSIERNS